jgi:MraZ protein
VKGMFIGEYHYNLDDKNRIFIPNDFKNEIGSQLIINRGIESCLYIYTIDEWSKIVNKLNNLSFTKKKNREFNRMFMSGAFKKDLDSKGRITLDKVLLEHSLLDKECVIIGVGERIEIWSKNEWNKYYEDKKESLDQISEEIELDY